MKTITLPRSSTKTKYKTKPNNTRGVIDSDYRREWKAALRAAIANAEQPIVRPKELADQAEWLADKIMGNDYIQEAAQLLRKMAPIVRANAEQAQPVTQGEIAQSFSEYWLTIISDDPSHQEVFEAGWKAGYKHGAWSAAPIGEQK